MEDLPLAEVLKDHKNLGIGCDMNCKAGEKLLEPMRSLTDSFDLNMFSSRFE